MIRIAVCESTPHILNQIEAALEKLQAILPGKIQYECFVNAADYKSAIAQGEIYQIAFVGMELSDMDGIALGRELRGIYRQQELVLIFLSTQTTFHRLVLETHPFHILAVPLSEREFIQTAAAALEELENNDALFLCKRGRTLHQIPKRQIICLESVRRNIVLSVVNQEDLIYTGAIKNELAHFCEINFLQPHQAYIVNLDHVKEYHTKSLLLISGKEIPISELRLREVKAAIMRYWEYRNLLCPSQ